MTMGSQGTRRRLRSMAALLVLLPTTLPTTLRQATQAKSTRSKHAADGSAKDAPAPFPVGETLNYRVAWAAFTSAASLQLCVVERRDLFGWRTWHFRATAHTSGSVRRLFTIDDQVDSYTDAASLESRQYETRLNEMGHEQDEVLHFMVSGQAAPPLGSGVLVAKGTRDPLGTIYWLRTVDWKQTTEARAPMCDGHDLYEVRAALDAPDEQLTTDAGKFAASRILIHIFQNGKQVTGTSFSVWLAHDMLQTPIRMQADLPIGTIQIELTSNSQ